MESSIFNVLGMIQKVPDGFMKCKETKFTEGNFVPKVN